MRFFLVFFLSAALISADPPSPPEPEDPRGIQFELPQGLPDGSIHTFTIWHKGDLGARQPVYIEFYNKVNFNLMDDHVIFAVDKGILDGAVASNTKVGIRWMTEQNNNNRLDDTPPSVGWWRVDVYKHDEFHMSVFLQGFWLGVRKFEMSLNIVKSVKVRSDFMYRNHVKLHINPLNTALFYPVSADVFNAYIDGRMGNSVKIATSYNLAIGAHLEMTVVMHTSTGENPKTPTFRFRPVGWEADSYFLKIVQEWTVLEKSMMYRTYFPRFFETHQLYLSGPGNYTDGTLCINSAMKPNGDLHHLDLTRISQNVVRLSVLSKFRAEIEKDVVSCDLILPEDVAKAMDGPFDTVSDDGALLLMVEMKSQ